MNERELAELQIRNHYDPTIQYSASPEYLQQLKDMSERDTHYIPRQYIDPEGKKWDVIGKTYFREELDLPRSQRHYSFFVARPTSTGFIHDLIPEAKFDQTKQKE